MLWPRCLSGPPAANLCLPASWSSCELASVVLVDLACMRRDRYQHRHRSLVRDTAPLSAPVALETQAEIAGYPVSAVQPPPAWIEAIAVSEETKKALRLYHAARMADAASKR